MADLKQRLAEFGLELHPTKTRLIELGRYTAANRRRRGLGKPETFDFLGRTHFCTVSQRDPFRLGRKPACKRVPRPPVGYGSGFASGGRWIRPITPGDGAGSSKEGSTTRPSRGVSGIGRALVHTIKRRFLRALRRRSNSGPGAMGRKSASSSRGQTTAGRLT